MTSISFAAGIAKTEAASQGWNGADTALKQARINEPLCVIIECVKLLVLV
jgi:hypothetical protein